ncbi:hypothetical protein ACROYT_G005019 [Oculina patagonica]
MFREVCHWSIVVLPGKRCNIGYFFRRDVYICILKPDETERFTDPYKAYSALDCRSTFYPSLNMKDLYLLLF